MTKESPEVPQDSAALAPLLMRGASTIRQVEAAERLVLQVPILRDWLIKKQFIRIHRDEGGVYAATYFDEAYEAANEIKRNGGDAALEESGLTESSWSVLGVAANLSGKVPTSLRYAVHEIDEVEAKLVAEAILYAFGFMDATVVMCSGENGSIGPNALEYERRVFGV